MLESPDMDPQDRAGLQLYLASNSPRRKELLSLFGLEYKVLPAQVDETPFPHEGGIEYVTRLARSKADTAASRMHGRGVIVAADTAVVDHNISGKDEILGKPANQQEALEMLRSLRGHTHQVYTSISIINLQKGTILSDICTTDVPMRNYSEEEIQAYVASGDPMDKAGAYAIQHAGFHPVEQLRGCFANVMGLPLCHLLRNLLQQGITPSTNVPLACQAALKYDCPVYHLVLKSKSFDLVSSQKSVQA